MVDIQSAAAEIRHDMGSD